MDPATHGILLETKGEKRYRIGLDLNATELNKNTLNEALTNVEIKIKNNQVNKSQVNIGDDTSNKYSNQKFFNIDPNAFQKEWIFSYVKATLGKNLNKKGFDLANDSIYLLDPEFIDELNFKPVRKIKVWIAHKSAIYGEYNSLISFIDAEGKELNRINLFEVFKNKKANILATYTQDKEILVFIGIGQTYRVDTKGFSLVALRTDPNTGKIIDKIKYF